MSPQQREMPPNEGADTPKASIEAEEKIENVDDDNDLETSSTRFNADETSETEAKLLRKIDLYLLPAIWLVYFLSYMDRSNIGNARVAGMGEELALTDQTYYYCVVLFQVGYVVAEIPSNMILARSRPSIFIPVIMLLWGTVCAAVASVQTWQQLVGMRFLLGVAEAGFSPAVIYLLSSWYRKREQAKRFVVFHSAGIVSGAFGSIIAGAVTDSLDGHLGIEGWRWLFIIEGVVTCGAGLIVPFIILDYPLTSKKLTEPERQLAYSRLLADGITSRNDDEASQDITHMEALWIAVSNWRLWYLTAGYMTVIGSMSLAYFYPTFVEYLGYNKTDAQYMTAPLYGVALAIAVPMCFIADRFPRYRALLASGTIFVLGAILCAVSAGVYQAKARYVFLCFINAAVWAGNPLTLSYVSIVLGPVHPEVRAICFAIVNGTANLSQLYGTYIFTASTPPKFVMGFAVYAAIFTIGAAIWGGAHFIFHKYPFKGLPETYRSRSRG